MDKLAVTTFPIHDLIRRRWSPRAFADRPVEPGRLGSLLEAARWAASSYNEQPWAFIVATREQTVEHNRLLECLVEFNRGWANAAPVLLLAVAHLNLAKSGQPNTHAVHDVGQALANLALQAVADGLMVHQMAGILPDKAQAKFAIPDGWKAVTGAAIGYPGSVDSLPEGLRERELSARQRKPLDEFVFAGQWGQRHPLTTIPAELRGN
jgi:nitroreductase